MTHVKESTYVQDAVHILSNFTTQSTHHLYSQILVQIPKHIPVLIWLDGNQIQVH